MRLLEEFDSIERELRAFAAAQVAPHAALIDREQRIPNQVIQSLAHAGVFASALPSALGGALSADGDPVAGSIRHGLLHEALGGASASVQGLANVQHMCASAIARWGTSDQKQEWVPPLATGKIIGAIAVTEPNVGSDAAAVETIAATKGPDYVITGSKSWITCGQIANVFVLLAASVDGPVAFVLPSTTPGLSIEPINDMLGCRGYMLAKLHLDSCRLSRDYLLGRAPFGLTHVIATALDSGRFNLAWACVGLARACLDAAFAYSKQRRQFNSYLSELQLIQRMISRMMTDLHAARLMCWQAALLRGQRNPAAIMETTMAKYYASTMANRVANDALQIHGANGCGPDYPLERFLRDARIMEIIEGTSQILEIAIARFGFMGHP